MKKEINVLVTFNLDEANQARIIQGSKGVNLMAYPVHNAEDVPPEVWANADVLFTQNVLPGPESAPNLKWVQFRYAGVERFLDHPLIKDRDILVTNMSGAITTQIAEYVLAVILALGRKLPKLIRQQGEKAWPSWKERVRLLSPLELRGSTVGIVGYGSIGRQVARLLQPFGATILACKKDVMHPEDTGYTPEGLGDPHGDFFDRLYPVEALHSLLSESDFVVLALPLTKSTHHIFDRKALEAMKPTAYLVNVGRGALVDETALIEALQETRIAGAALDVFEEEPLPEESPLWDLQNVIISPHISGLSLYFNEDTLSLFIENLKRFKADLPLYNQVNKGRGY